jgi:hypothetical protein
MCHILFVIVKNQFLPKTKIQFFKLYSIPVHIDEYPLSYSDVGSLRYAGCSAQKAFSITVHHSCVFRPNEPENNLVWSRLYNITNIDFSWIIATGTNGGNEINMLELL